MLYNAKWPSVLAGSLWRTNQGLGTRLYIIISQSPTAITPCLPAAGYKF